MRWVLYTSLAVLIGLISLRFGLFFIAEPSKFLIWEFLNSALPLTGCIAALLALIALFLKRRQMLLVSVAQLAVSAVAIALPFAGGYLGMPYPVSIEDAKEALEIRVPMDGPVMVAWGGDSPRINYHAAYPDQRWAYDLVVYPHSVESNKLTDFGCYGKTVVAPVSGEIRTAIDGEPDLVPGEDFSGPNNFGNYIVIKPEDRDDARLVIAHLRKDSVLVERGQLVSEGEAIAECGNSGNSTEPHIHIHFLRIVEHDDDSILIGQPLYFRNHGGNPMPEGGFKRVDGRHVVDGELIMHRDF